MSSVAGRRAAQAQRVWATPPEGASGEGGGVHLGGRGAGFRPGSVLLAAALGSPEEQTSGEVVGTE